MPLNAESNSSIDVGDVKQVSKKKQKRKHRRDQELEDLRRVLDMAGGRNFIWRLLSECGIYHSSFAGEYPLTMANNEGKRQIGLWTLEEIFDASPHTYALMQKENRKPNE